MFSVNSYAVEKLFCKHATLVKILMVPGHVTLVAILYTGALSLNQVSGTHLKKRHL